MKVTITKDELAARAGARLAAAHGMLGPTGSAVRAFLSLCGGRGEGISFTVPDAGEGSVTREAAVDAALDVIAPRVRVYVCFGSFVADMIHEALEGLAAERGHRDLEVKGVRCFDNNGVLHLETSIRDCRTGVLHEERSTWNSTQGNYAVNVDDTFVRDCLDCGGLGLPLTRWFAGAYPKGDYCTIQNLAAYGTEAGQ